MPNRLLLIDVSNLVARCYHVAARGKEGESVYGLAKHHLKKMAQSLERQVEPLRVCAAIDSAYNFRKLLYPDYKAHRGEKDAELIQLLEDAPAILQAELGAECYVAPGFEADDVIATLAQAALPYEWRIVISSNDADLHQLICDLGGGAGVFALQSDQGAYRSLGPKDVLAGKMGVPPLRVPMFKSLAGDVGDNIPGANGIGPVAARRIASEHRSVKQMFANLDRLCKADRAKVEAAGQDYLELMLTLTTLRSDAPLQRCA